MRRSKRLRVLVGVALLAALGVCWWVLRYGPSQPDRLLVGTWHHHYGPSADFPDGHDRFWILSPDHSCRIENFDPATGQTDCIVSGRWYATDEKFVCDWEEDWLARAKRVLPARWRGFHDTKIEWSLIVSVDDDELVLRPRGGPSTYPLRRVAGK